MRRASGPCDALQVRAAGDARFAYRSPRRARALMIADPIRQAPVAAVLLDQLGDRVAATEGLTEIPIFCTNFCERRAPIHVTNSAGVKVVLF